MKFLHVSIFFAIYYPSFSQQAQMVTINGNLVDHSSNLPINNAVCFLKNNDHIGVVSDKNGSLVLSFPKTLIYDTLIVSSLAYERVSIPLSQIDTSKDLIKISMKERTLLLDELIIEATGYDLKKLVLNSVANISKNYPDRAHQLKGLYRRVSTEKKQYKYLEEAVVLVEDHDYKNYQRPSKIKVNAYRQSKDWGKIDTLMVKVLNKIREKAVKNFNLSNNSLHRLFESNYIRVFNKDGTHFNFNTLKGFIDDHYKFELVDILTPGRDTIYHVAFSEGPFPERPSGRTYLKINSSDLGIVEFQISSGFKGNNNLLHQVLVKFRKVDNRYYPYYIKTVQPRYINREIDDGEYDIEIYQFDEVKTKDFRKIRSKESINRLDMESHKSNSYDPGFWKDIDESGKYPVLDQGVKLSLEKNQSLEEQFEEASRQ
ncbi:MAG: hypothetical protein MI975_20435 [Cytophagales bacterium]|nr:hypothetical protein [Cytophagales bacterium]